MKRYLSQHSFPVWRIIFVLIAILIASPARAQISYCPADSTNCGITYQSNNGPSNQFPQGCIPSNNGGCRTQNQGGPNNNGTYPSHQHSCHVIIEFPSRMELNVAGDDCDPNGMLSGHSEVSFTVDIGVRPNVTFTINSHFVAGKMSGQTEINTDAVIGFSGYIDATGRAVGRTTNFDGSIIDGAVSPGFKNITGTLTAPARRGGQVDYFIAGQSVSREEYQASSPRSVPLQTQSASSFSTSAGPLPPPPAKGLPCLSPRYGNDKSGVLRFVCGKKLANGFLTFERTEPNGYHVTYIGSFSAGTPTGNFYLVDHSVGFTYIGTLEGLGRGNGTTRFADGHSEYGQFKGGHLYNGKLEKPGPHGQTITLSFWNGQQAGQSEGEQIAAIVERFNPKHVVRMTKMNLDGTTCLADLPRDRFTIKAEMPGRCKAGYYTGRATLELTELGAQTKAMTVNLSYQNGLIVGTSKVTYPSGQGTFIGSLNNWDAYQGEFSRHIGNDNYEVTSFAGGQVTDERTEYRQPSESTLAGRRLVGTILQIAANAAVSCTVGPCAQARHDKKAYNRQQEEYRLAQAQRDQEQQAQQARQDQLRAAQVQQQAVDALAREQEAARIERQRVIDDAQRRAVAAVTEPNADPAQKSHAPVEVARSDPPPVFVADTKPPVDNFQVGTNPPEFSGDAKKQGDPPVLTTNPPELPGPSTPEPLPAPINNGQQREVARADPPPASYPNNQDGGLPGPNIGDQGSGQPGMPTVGQQSGGGAGASSGLSSPITGSNGIAGGQLNGIGSNQNDTLGTGQNVQSGSAPSNNQSLQPTAQPENVQRVSTPSQVVNTLARPSSPSETYPGYPTEQSAIVFADSTPTFGWSSVPDATQYQLAVRDLSSGGLVIDRSVGSTSYTPTQPLPAGHLFRWDVAACNAAGCSGRSVDKYFRTGGGTPKVLTYDDLMTPRERGIFEEHFGYLARIPESNPPAKFTPEHVKRMQDSDRWAPYIKGIEQDNLSLRQLDRDPPDFCGSGFTSFVPDRILRTDIYPACRTHDVCYASAATQLQCDTGIRDDILDICRAKNASKMCYFAAKSYYNALRLLGGIAYRNAQSNREK